MPVKKGDKRGRYKDAIERRLKEREALKQLGIKPGGKDPGSKKEKEKKPESGGTDDPGSGGAPGTGSLLRAPDTGSLSKQDAASSAPGNPDAPPEQVKSPDLEGYEGLEDAIHSAANNVPEMIRSFFDRGEKFEVKPVSKKESRMLSKSWLRFIKKNSPDFDEAEETEGTLFIKHLIVGLGKIRRRKVKL